jgi:transcriptional regulator GlxA family with amidase domain
VTRRIVFAAYPDVQLLDVVGPAEAFAMANGRRPEYRIEVATPAASPVTSRAGLRLAADVDLAAVRGPIDTLVVPGGVGSLAVSADSAYLASVRRLAARSRRVTSVCSGSLLLAAAGLLDGRRATSHWSVCDHLATSHPEVRVEPDAIFVRDGDVWTSAGVTAGIDLTLALIEDDLGRDVALQVARWLVVFVRRPGGQSQFSAQLEHQFAERDSIRDVQSFVAEHPEAPHSVASLAARAHMSERNFARVFHRDVGCPPAAYVERVRSEVARRLLEETGLGLDDVAAAAGFGSVETLRRVVHRRFGVAPSDYRARFRTTV